MHVGVKYEIDDQGDPIPFDSLAQTYTYNGDDQLATITAVDGARSWVKTFGYTAGKLTSISKWILQ